MLLYVTKLDGIIARRGDAGRNVHLVLALVQRYGRAANDRVNVLEDRPIIVGALAAGQRKVEHQLGLAAPEFAASSAIGSQQRFQISWKI